LYDANPLTSCINFFFFVWFPIFQNLSPALWYYCNINHFNIIRNTKDNFFHRDYMPERYSNPYVHIQQAASLFVIKCACIENWLLLNSNLLVLKLFSTYILPIRRYYPKCSREEIDNRDQISVYHIEVIPNQYLGI
jgi:hypothetical protein